MPRSSQLRLTLKLCSIIFFISFFFAESSAKRRLKADTLNSSRSGLSLEGYKCKNLDETFSRTLKCKEETIRSGRYFSFHAKLLKTPVTEASVNLKIFEWKSSKVPFIEHGIDLCKFLAERNNYFFNVLFNIFMKYTNLNTTCPHFTEIVVVKMPTTKISFPISLPGKYHVEVIVSAYGVPRGLLTVNVALF